MRRRDIAIVLAAVVSTPLPLVAGTVTGTVLTKPAARQKAPPRYYLGPYRAGRWWRKEDRRTWWCSSTA